jgi:hypothetical protein
VPGQSELILVRAERPRGEIEQINRERTAGNIVQVLSSEFITSLPNANVADEPGQLPSVALERDEDEGKSVQIRGTEPDERGLRLLQRQPAVCGPARILQADVRSRRPMGFCRTSD